MPTQDLSRPLDADTWTYPGDPPVAIEPHATIDADGYRVCALSLGTHAGTHLDAPSHTERDGATVDDLPVETFAFDAVLAEVDAGPREPIRRGQLPPIPDGADLLVLDTGWAAHWGTDRYLDHPFLTAEAAARCARRGASVAIDAPSVDPTPPADAVDGDGASDGARDQAAHHPAHRALLGAGRVIVENLARLDGLPDRFELRAYPLPVSGVDGSPVRAVAVY